MSLTMLPNELIFNILLRLPYHDVINYCKTNSKAWKIYQDLGFWRIKATSNLAIDLDKFDYIDKPANKYYEALKIFAEKGLSEHLNSFVIRAINLGLTDNDSLCNLLIRATYKRNLRITEYLLDNFNFDDEMLTSIAIISVQRCSTNIYHYLITRYPQILHHYELWDILSSVLSIERLHGPNGPFTNYVRECGLIDRLKKYHLMQRLNNKLSVMII